MVLTLILLAAIGVIVLAERSAEHLPFAISMLSLSAAAISFIVGDFDRHPAYPENIRSPGWTGSRRGPAKPTRMTQVV